jgi:hypothetical protein
MRKRVKKVLIGTTLAAVVALVMVFSISSLAGALTPVSSSADPSGGAMKVYSTSQNVTLAPGKDVLLYVSCTTSSCSPNTYHSAAVTITFVSESFAASTPTLYQIFWFGAPKCGLSHACPNEIHPVTDYKQGPTTLLYDAYATEIVNNATATASFTVAFSFTAEYEAAGT